MDKLNRRGQVSVGVVALILAAIVGIFGAMKGKSKTTRMRSQWVALILGGLAIAGMFFVSGGYGAFFQQDVGDLLGGSALSVGGGTTGTVTSGGATCFGVEDTTVTLAAQDVYTAAAVGGAHRYKIGNAPAIQISDGGTFTASPGDVIKVLWGNTSLSGGNYFGEVTTDTVACKGTQTISNELYQNGTLTIEVFNEEGNLIDTVGENETLANGDVVTLESKLKGTFQRGFPSGGVLSVEWNNTAIDDVVIDFGGSEVSVPQVYSRTYGAESSTRAFSVPAILGNQILAGTVVIDSDDTVNPGLANDVIIEFRPNDVYVDEDNGGAFSGPAVEDEDNAATFGHITSFTLNID